MLWLLREAVEGAAHEKEGVAVSASLVAPLARAMVAGWRKGTTTRERSLAVLLFTEMVALVVLDRITIECCVDY